MFGIGISECVVLVMLIVIFLGANRLPEIGRSLGDAMRENKSSTRERRDSDAPDRRGRLD